IGREIDLDLGLLLEFLQHFRIDVFAPVVDVEFGGARHSGRRREGGKRKGGAARPGAEAGCAGAIGFRHRIFSSGGSAVLARRFPLRRLFPSRLLRPLTWMGKWYPYI